MNLRLSCADSSFRKLPHEAALAAIKGLGFEAVDVCVFAGYEHTPPEAVLDSPSRAADAVRERLEKHELLASDVFAIVGLDFQQLAPNHPDPGVRADSFEQFKAMLEFARKLGSPGMTVLPGATFRGIDENESLELAASELNRRAALTGETGMRLSFEPHFGSVAATPARALAIADLAADVGFALDYSHFIYQGIRTEEVDPLLGRTNHVHVRQAAPTVIQARAREGTIDFCGVRDRLLGIGYAGYFALEYQWEDGSLDFTRVDCISETAEMREVLLTGLNGRRAESGVR